MSSGTSIALNMQPIHVWVAVAMGNAVKGRTALPVHRIASAMTAHTAWPGCVREFVETESVRWEKTARPAPLTVVPVPAPAVHRIRRPVVIRFW